MRLVKRIAGVAILLAVASATVADATADNSRLDGFAYLGADFNSGGCSPLSVAAQIHGVERCLRAGRPCQQRYTRQYQRYGFNCVAVSGRYRLTRRPALANAHRDPAGTQPGGLAYLGGG